MRSSRLAARAAGEDPILFVQAVFRAREASPGIGEAL